MPSERLKHVVGALAVTTAVWVGVVASLDALARWAESQPNVYLWWWSEWRQLLVAGNYVDRGAGRVMICGASEMREGILVDALDEGLPGRSVFQDAFSLATLESARLQLEYVESVYGASAMPDAIVLGLTPRFALNAPPAAMVPVAVAIGQYGERDVDLEGRAELVERGVAGLVAARIGRATSQTTRHRTALWATFRVVTGAPDPWSLPPFRPPKWHQNEPLSTDQYDARAAQARSAWPRVFPSQFVRAELATIRELAERNDVLLLAVDMPTSSWIHASYPDGFYDAYEHAVASALGDTPLLELGQFLADDEFFDGCHAARSGAVRITERVAAFVNEHLEPVR